MLEAEDKGLQSIRTSYKLKPKHHKDPAFPNPEPYQNTNPKNATPESQKFQRFIELLLGPVEALVEPVLHFTEPNRLFQERVYTNVL